MADHGKIIVNGRQLPLFGAFAGPRKWVTLHCNWRIFPVLSVGCAAFLPQSGDTICRAISKCWNSPHDVRYQDTELNEGSESDDRAEYRRIFVEYQ